ncbi:sugar phosphate isomerase/epimerase family protein [Pelagicoccus mobilis]|uniref:Sugar phosphate isomerase/epimerase n=1 Tax=Pelagicoccus mobilis TaxID=415221 RepID=A0A934S394_9BACT|nr:TIM barrel protein [Pelagicoccus mobilis]MBK1879012.1 sugar phosphate isomerase/epimerase [Pelagicoccus mobilis]
MMKELRVFIVVFVCLLAAGYGFSKSNEGTRIKGLYTYDFGGLETMEVEAVVDLLVDLKYSGIVVNGRGESSLRKFDEYMEMSEKHGDDFRVHAMYLTHPFGKYGFSDTDHRAAIDRIAGKGVDLWVWGRDKKSGSVTDEQVEKWVRGIVEYAASKKVKVVLYSHYGTYFPTALDALPLVKKIDSPFLGLSINLFHEIKSGADSVFAETFEQSGDYISTVIISGSTVGADGDNSGAESTSLEESEYDLLPFVKLIREHKTPSQIGFVNFKLTEEPEVYLKRSMDRWVELWGDAGSLIYD